MFRPFAKTVILIALVILVSACEPTTTPSDTTVVETSAPATATAVLPTQTATSIPSPTMTPTPTPPPPLSGSGGGIIAISAFNPVNYQSEIELMNADGSDQHALTALADGHGLSPAWSPDGRRIVFYNHINNDVWSVYVMDADGSNVQRLTTSNTQDGYPTWSPDGRQIAFVRDGDIWVMQVSSGPELQVSNLRALTSTPDQYEGDPAWSPDGTQIAFTSNRGGPRQDDPNFDATTAEIYVMNVDGTNIQRLTDNHWVDSEPTWSPDGRQVAFTANPDGNYQIYVMDSAGHNLQRLTDNHANDASPAWSPDGTKIAFNSDRDGNEGIYAMNVDGSNQLRLTGTSMIYWNPVWQPAPTTVSTPLPPPASSAAIGDLGYCYQPDNGLHQIYVINLDGSGNRKLITATIGLNHLDWSPDGQKIAAVGYMDRSFTTWSIHVFNVDGSGLKRLTTQTGAADSEPAWSPDGTRIAFSRIHFTGSTSYNSQIWVMNADGSDQHLVLADGFAAEWSPDGKRLIYTSNKSGNYEIYTANVDGTDEQRLTDTPAHESYPAWSPDGQYIAFTASTGTWNSPASMKTHEIFVINADGSGRRQLTNNQAYDGRPRWSPNGTQIVFDSDQDETSHYEVYVMNADGTNAQQVTHTPAGATAVNPVWRPTQ